MKSYALGNSAAGLPDWSETGKSRFPVSRFDASRDRNERPAAQPAMPLSARVSTQGIEPHGIPPRSAYPGIQSRLAPGPRARAVDRARNLRILNPRNPLQSSRDQRRYKHIAPPPVSEAD